MAELTTPLNIGPHRLAGPVLLAPMAGISDAPFRAVARRFGAALTFSEMTTADTRLWRTAKSRRRLAELDGSMPFAVQIAGSEPAQMAEAARAVAGAGAQLVDINMGCPAKKVCRRLAGSALLADELLVGRILDAVVGAVNVPVSLKIRTGSDPAHRNASTIARIAEQSGVKSLTVHGRTRACRFTGTAEHDSVAAVRRAVNIPVFANGDIATPADATRIMAETKVDGVMIGRATRGQPWLLNQLHLWLTKKEFVPVLSMRERRDTILFHLDAMYRFYGEQTGVRVARKHLVWYSANLESGDAFRQEVLQADNSRDQLRITREHFSRAGDVVRGCENSGRGPDSWETSQSTTPINAASTAAHRRRLTGTTVHR